MCRIKPISQKRKWGASSSNQQLHGQQKASVPSVPLRQVARSNSCSGGLSGLGPTLSCLLEPCYNGPTALDTIHVFLYSTSFSLTRKFSTSSESTHFARTSRIWIAKECDQSSLQQGSRLCTQKGFTFSVISIDFIYPVVNASDLDDREVHEPIEVASCSLITCL